MTVFNDAFDRIAERVPHERRSTEFGEICVPDDFVPDLFVFGGGEALAAFNKGRMR